MVERSVFCLDVDNLQSNYNFKFNLEFNSHEMKSNNNNNRKVLIRHVSDIKSSRLYYKNFVSNDMLDLSDKISQHGKQYDTILSQIYCGKF